MRTFTLKCSRKRYFTTRLAAEKARAQAPWGESTQAYSCPFCLGWHLGQHRSKQRRRR